MSAAPEHHLKLIYCVSEGRGLAKSFVHRFGFKILSDDYVNSYKILMLDGFLISEMQSITQMNYSNKLARIRK